MKLENKNVVIIGGGYAGLSIGSYLQMNGFNTRVLEKDAICGGISVQWSRKGYTFDGATNYLPGSSPNFNIHEIMNEIVNFSEMEIYDYDEFICVEHEDERFHVYTNADRLKEEMLRIAPEDEKVITNFTEAVKKFGSFSLPIDKAPELYGPIDGLQLLIKYFPFILFKSKWAKITIAQYAEKFKNKKLRYMFKCIFPHHEHFSVMAPMAPLGWMHWKKAGYPMGGSGTIISQFIKRYENLGGIIENKKEVSKIEVTGDKASGVICKDGSKYSADIIIGAGDLYNTLFELFDPQFIDSKTKKRFNKLTPFSAIVQVSLGIKRTFENESEKSHLPLTEQIHFGNHIAEDMMVRICSFDDCYAPKGATSVIVQIRNEEGDYWENLRNNNMEQYKKEKEHIADVVIDSLEKRFGNVKKNVEAIDVATPATFKRYTNLYKGAHQGWAPTPDAIGNIQKRTLPKVKNFYLTGQWLSPAGGIPSAVGMSRQTTQVVCKNEGIKFTTTKA